MSRRHRKRRKPLLSRGYDRRHDRIYKIIIVICLVLFAIMFLISKLLDRDSFSIDDIQQTAWGSEYYGIDAGVDEALAGYRNFVLYGVDAKGKSDIIIIASENKLTHDITLTSINRDTYLECKKGKFHKANRGYAWGGIDQGLWELNHCLDLNCRDAIALDWDAVEEIVDRVGGVEVDIKTEAFLNMLNEMLEPDNQVKGTGKQKLNGKQAVQYCRIRKDSDSFIRGQRNVEVFATMFEKAKTIPKKKLIKTYKEMRYSIYSNINQNTVLERLYALSENHIIQQNSWPEKYETWWAGYYYYVPRTLTSEVSALHERLFDQMDYQPTDTVLRVNNKIEKHLKNGKLSREP